jgi:hypothetical protein
MLAALSTAQVFTPQTGAPVAAAGGVVGAAPQNIPGAPFSADVVTEVTRTLPNGETFHSKMQGKLYRDSQGRTRRESQFQSAPSAAASSGRSVVVNDPVQHVMIVFNEAAKTAMVFRWPSSMTNHMNPAPASSAASREASPSPAVPSPYISARPGGTATLTGGPATAAKTTSEKLGSRELDGVTATGTRTIRSWTTGDEANPQPHSSTTDIWMSPELELTLLSETTEAHSGKTVTRVENLLRSEPDASLFQIPADYTVTDKTKPKPSL